MKDGARAYIEDYKNKKKASEAKRLAMYECATYDEKHSVFGGAFVRAIRGTASRRNCARILVEVRARSFPRELETLCDTLPDVSPGCVCGSCEGSSSNRGRVVGLNGVWVGTDASASRWEN